MKLSLKHILSGALMAGTLSASAADIFYEGFDYETGSIASTPWGAGHGTTNIDSTALTYTDKDLTGGALRTKLTDEATRSFGADFDSMTFGGMVYISMLIDDQGTMTTTKDYSSNAMRLKDNTGSNNLMFGIQNGQVFISDSWGGMRHDAGAAFAAGTTTDVTGTNMLVLAYDITNQSASVYLNPDVTGTQPLTAEVTASVDHAADKLIGGTNLVAYDKNWNDHVVFDEIIVGSSWDSVMNPPSAVPEPSAAGLLIIAGLLFIRRRR